MNSESFYSKSKDAVTLSGEELLKVESSHPGCWFLQQLASFVSSNRSPERILTPCCTWKTFSLSCELHLFVSTLIVFMCSWCVCVFGSNCFRKIKLGIFFLPILVKIK